MYEDIYYTFCGCFTPIYDCLCCPCRCVKICSYFPGNTYQGCCLFTLIYSSPHILCEYTYNYRLWCIQRCFNTDIIPY